jgi:hypothetical protein
MGNPILFLRSLSFLIGYWAALASNGLAEEAEFDAARFAGRYALVYAGPSAGRGCPESVARIARDIGLKVKFIDEPKNIPQLLDDAAVFIVGGTTGDMEPVRTALTSPRIAQALRDYLNDGGRYWGICGGGYLASQRYQGYGARRTALQIIPANAEDYSDGGKAKLERVVWRGKKRDLFVQGSPSFLITDKTTPVEIVATFRDDSIAAMICAYGKGKVAVSGPHPEATTAWLDEADIDTDDWRPTRPLAEALLKDLLSDREIKRQE